MIFLLDCSFDCNENSDSVPISSEVESLRAFFPRPSPSSSLSTSLSSSSSSPSSSSPHSSHHTMAAEPTFSMRLHNVIASLRARRSVSPLSHTLQTTALPQLLLHSPPQPSSSRTHLNPTSQMSQSSTLPHHTIKPTPITSSSSPHIAPQTSSTSHLTVRTFLHSTPSLIILICSLLVTSMLAASKKAPHSLVTSSLQSPLFPGSQR